MARRLWSICSTWSPVELVPELLLNQLLVQTAKAPKYRLTAPTLRSSGTASLAVATTPPCPAENSANVLFLGASRGTKMPGALSSK